MTSFGTLRLARDGRFPATATDFTALDFRTTGLRPGHVVELAAVRARADGTVLTEFATLVDPGRQVEPGPATLHRISRRDLDNAPEFGEVLGDLLDLCRGSVLVAHNLPFALEFLAAELARLNVRLPPLPVVGTLDAARQALHLPNAQLATVADALGIGEFPGHLALANARTVACVVSSLVTTHRLAFTDPPRLPQLPRFTSGGRVLTRPVEDPAERSWLAELVERVRVGDGGDPLHEAYRELLKAAISDQYVSPDEAHELASLAAAAGIAVRRTHLDFVTAMREVAADDGVITEVEAHDLTRVATALGVPEVARDLRTAERLRTPMRVLVLGETRAADALRAAVLAAGIQLAKNLTASVSHLAIADDVPRQDPRLGRARERGIVVLDITTAWTVLGLLEPPPTPFSAPVSVRAATPPAPTAPPAFAPTARLAPVAPPPRSPATPARQLWAARALMAAGLVVMLFSILALFGGAPFAGGLVLAVFGVGALCAGWYLADPAPN
ncbi:3'-5' exonuclease [Amycolatopsis acidiphila]|uniref:3'-5' exonuclease n=1 Tax=Amycolatopsis acidiphila TaxID=715473 RepID=A0A558AMQ8_9PSEU|nr:3'-5' exonuclease [Amycolatopsis acidiphila]TVT25510.1 3'-5' exonuclease [Amycolatopsis acidiphila]UIJ60252.1 3'-5' exonuclease [Amycolatopsis acidiphila]GHG60496.1 DNA polymerase III subunit epsilon [Amycolatopsis acidiphila]